jgi:hypothetical protein
MNLWSKIILSPIGILCIPLAMAGSLTPQEPENNKRFSIGIKTGLSLANVAYKTDTLKLLGLEPSGKAGLSTGFAGAYRLSPSFSIQAELLYIQKGFMYEASHISLMGFSFPTPEARLFLNYLELPLLARGEVKAGPLKILVSGGPSFAYALNGKYTVEEIRVNGTVLQERTSGKINFDGSDRVKRFDLGIKAGAGVGYSFNKSLLMLEVRYGRSFTEYRNDITAPKNTGIEINLGYFLQLGKQKASGL